MVANTLPRMPSRILHDACHAEVGLTHGKIALVSIPDFQRINESKWLFHKSFQERAVRWANGVWTYMHHEVLEVTGAALKAKGLEVDHINGNQLDNRRENLRITDHTSNMRNTARHKNRIGVMLHKPSGLWFAYLNYHHNQVVSLGYWRTKEKALEVVALGRQLQDTCPTVLEFKEKWKIIRPRKPYDRSAM